MLEPQGADPSGPDEQTGKRSGEQRTGPLAGVWFVEFDALGPVPFAGMVLADLGATGIRLTSPTPRYGVGDTAASPTGRGRPSLTVDLKQPGGVDLALRLVDRADLLLEGFRPGVMERLGVGPQACLARNPRLVYGRMTGWGQDGPLAPRAGHDLTYLAVAGALAHIGRAGAPPTPPLNLVADYGGGAMMLVSGLLAALVHAGRSGQGQVVDVAMVDGVALLMSLYHGLRAQGQWQGLPGTNLLDSGAPFYDVYPTADGEYVAVGALEPQFFAALLRGLGLDPADLPDQYDEAGWPVLRQRLAGVLATRTRDEWAARFVDTDACVAPVLRMDEAPGHSHLAARGTFVTVDGVVQARPAPRFSGTPATLPPTSDPASAPAAGLASDAGPASDAGRDLLLAWGLTAEEVTAYGAGSR